MNPQEIVNRDVALIRLGGDEELFRDLVGFAIEDIPILQQQIRAALDEADAHQLMHSAHALKGLCAGLDARRTMKAAERLEMCGRSGDLSYANRVLDELTEELSWLHVALQLYVGDQQSVPESRA